MSETTPDPVLLPPEDCEDRFAYGEALQRLRARSGLSIRVLHRRCTEVHWVSKSTVEHWCNGGVVSAVNEPAFRDFLRAMGVTDQAALASWTDVARRLRARRGSPPVAEPYRGLRSYDAESAAVFHGRVGLVEEVLESVDGFREGGGALVLTGASGTGKSSLLNAGVAPALAAGKLAGSKCWPVLHICAESHEPYPLIDLARAIAAHLKDDPETVFRELRSGAEAVEALCRRIVSDPQAGSSSPGRPVGADARLVVMVDQFERAVVSAEDGPGSENVLAEFVGVLQAMTSAPAAAIVIIGVRLDFLDAVMSRRDMRVLTQGRPPVFVRPMSEDDLARVIERPARTFHVNPEPGFVEKVLGDVSARGGRLAHQAGVLPLLSHALQMTWDRGGGQEMTIAHYEAAGGVEGALRSTAESVHANLSLAQQAVARRVFLSLVHVQSSGVATRRRVSQDDLFEEVGGDQGDIDLVVDLFVERRLLIVDGSGLEITHEALMAAWPELRSWLDADWGSRLVAQQVSVDARVWDRAGRPNGDLYAATRLQAARAWRENYPADAGELARLFVAASVRRARRRSQLMSTTICGLLSLVCIAGVLTGVVLYQAGDLKEQRDQAQSRSLAGQSVLLRDKDVNLARQLALIAFRTSPTVEARSALVEATALPAAARMLGGDKRRIMYAVGIHPGGRVAAAAAEGTVRLWDISAPGRPRSLPPIPGAACEKIYALAFSPRGDLLAVSCDGGSIRLWDTRDPMVPRPLEPLTGLGTKVYSVVFSPDGAMMAAALTQARTNGALAGSARLWSASGTSLRPLGRTIPAGNSAAKSVAFRPGNRALAIGSDDGSVRIWDISSPSRPSAPVTAPGGTKAVGQLAFSPDGLFLAAGGADNLVRLWSTADPSKAAVAGKPIGGSATYINAVTFSPDSATLALASSDSNTGTRLVDVRSRRVIATLPHPSPVTSVKFSPDGHHVITGANDGTARLWPVRSPTVEGLDYILSAARFAPGGRTLALGSADFRLLDITDPQYPKPLGQPHTNPDKFSGTLAFASHRPLLVEGRGRSGTVQLWDTTDPARPTPIGPPLRAHPAQVETVAFSPDDKVLATGGRDGTVRLWDIRTPRKPVPLSTPGSFDGFVNQVAFSPDGTVIVAASTDKTVKMWNISNARNPRLLGKPLTPADHYLYAAAFSPDGRTLALGLADGTIHLYDTSDRSLPRLRGKPLTGPEGYVFSIAFSPQGSSLAATGGDGTIWIWRLDSLSAPTRHATLRMGTGTMYPVHFHPRLPLLVSGGDEKKAWIWTTDTDKAADLICGTTGDRITPEEWAKYLPADVPYAPPCS
ncbi:MULTISPECIES: helix-turn-helix domain-containing protein [Streptomyces]|uniref:nSTAND1 domain-containing NTPase n=1 Tax=Streptomyces TaxID=1883 RepID=UPI001644683C|nr:MULTISPECIES: helix-turn-helix domain-containing protein [Streptomyces]MBT3078362.1 hypothetical protein [Streptomyces sp. COG21]MBT3087688.1 hypothetical protein [Streptomyces sp. CYG21]MBT3099390.1 hypothetical protein [Streptomyces sp. CBG30]MBT3104006.1 hypothetical protein [Streptomyces sp. COG19]MBT3113412.1 hypothetical protein [Streptomyces sp. CYG20]